MAYIGPTPPRAPPPPQVVLSARSEELTEWKKYVQDMMSHLEEVDVKLKAAREEAEGAVQRREELTKQRNECARDLAKGRLKVKKLDLEESEWWGRLQATMEREQSQESVTRPTTNPLPSQAPPARVTSATRSNRPASPRHQAYKRPRPQTPGLRVTSASKSSPSSSSNAAGSRDPA